MTWRTLWVAYVVWVLFMALIPVSLEAGVPHLDKLLHFGAFAVMIAAFPFRISWPRLWMPTALTVILAAFIEIAQDIAPSWGRNPEFLDFFAGVAGGMVGLGLRFALPLLRREKTQP
ncbi:MAG: hypothetical protein V3573_01705 [Desulfovibrionaceae bacterium]